ncbi:MAG: PqqD family protein [Eubacterium sp.]|nr:PqqD family protein [Eubacterium sp.]
MKIKEGFLVREVSGQTVIIPNGECNQDFKGMIKLNETGKLIWEALAEGKSQEAIAEQMVKEYGITKENALQDVQGFLEKIKEEGFLEE